jgi:hypothetical protein
MGKKAKKQRPEFKKKAKKQKHQEQQKRPPTSDSITAIFKVTFPLPKLKVNFDAILADCSHHSRSFKLKRNARQLLMFVPLRRRPDAGRNTATAAAMAQSPASYFLSNNIYVCVAHVLPLYPRPPLPFLILAIKHQWRAVVLLTASRVALGLWWVKAASEAARQKEPAGLIRKKQNARWSSPLSPRLMCMSRPFPIVFS